MGYNIVYNALALGVFLYLAMGLVIIFTVGNQIDTNVRAQVTALGYTIPPGIINWYADFKSMFLTSCRWMLWFFVGLSVISSWVNNNDFKDYVIGAVAGVIVSAIMVMIGTMVWNGFVQAGGAVLDFSDFGSGFLFIVTYFPEIVFLNLVAGLASFVWTRNRGSFSQEYIPMRGMQ